MEILPMHPASAVAAYHSEAIEVVHAGDEAKMCYAAPVGHGDESSSIQDVLVFGTLDWANYRLNIEKRKNSGVTTGATCDSRSLRAGASDNAWTPRTFAVIADDKMNLESTRSSILQLLRDMSSGKDIGEMRSLAKQARDRLTARKGENLSNWAKRLADDVRDASD